MTETIRVLVVDDSALMRKLIPAVLLRSLPWLAGVTAFPPDLDRLFELAIPVAFASTVVRFRFLDIDIIIRRSLIYGTLAAVLASIYLLVGGVVARRLMERAPQYAAFIQVLAVAVPVILYAPARRWIAAWVDGTFFKTQHEYAQVQPVPGRPDPITTLEQALDARPCTKGAHIWVTETGVGGDNPGAQRPIDDASLRAQCRAHRSKPPPTPRCAARNVIIRHKQTGRSAGRN